MDINSLMEKLNRLEYHQSLLLKMVNSEDEFYKLIIGKQLNKDDVEQFYTLCTELSETFEEQKAEGFVYFLSLFKKFQEALHPNLHVEEVIEACLRQQLYVPLMLEFKKFI